MEGPKPLISKKPLVKDITSFIFKGFNLFKKHSRANLFVKIFSPIFISLIGIIS